MRLFFKQMMMPTQKRQGKLLSKCFSKMSCTIHVHVHVHVHVIFIVQFASASQMAGLNKNSIARTKTVQSE